MNYSEFYRTKIPVLKALTRSKCDFLTFKEIEDWINSNCRNDDEGKYYLLKILLHTIFYSKKDLIKLLKYGLFELVWSQQIKDGFDKFEDFILPKNYYRGLVKEKIKQTCFIPLLDSQKPYESGNLVTGDLVHKVSIPTQNVFFLNDLQSEEIKNFNQLIIVDDCIGSGNQLKKFWNSTQLKFIKDYSVKNEFKITYLALIGYIESVERLKKVGSLKGVNVVVVDKLTNENRIFHPANQSIWDTSKNEREKALNYFKNLQKTKGVSFKGFSKLDFAVILSEKIPNWSLPIFHKKSPDWDHLITRKTT